MIFAGYDCKVWYKKESNTYGDYDNIVPLGAGEWYNIPLINTISFNWDSQHPPVTGLEQRTRRVGTTATYPVVKEDYTCTLDVMFEASEANSVCNLSTGGLLFYADIAHNNNAGQPQQFSFLVETDSLRDATWDVDTAAEASDNYWLLTGCYVNSVTISGSEGEYIKCAIELSVRDINYTTYATSDGIAGVANAIYNNIAAPTLCSFVASNLAKAANFTVNASVDEVSAFSITINNNFTKVWGMDAVIPFAASPGACEITGSFTKAFVDMEEFAEIDTANPTGVLTLVITCPTGGVQTVTLTDVTYDSLGMELGETELINQELSFTASSVTLT